MVFYTLTSLLNALVIFMWRGKRIFFFFSQNYVNIFVLQFVHEKEIVAEDDQVFLMKQQVNFCLSNKRPVFHLTTFSIQA